MSKKIKKSQTADVQTAQPAPAVEVQPAQPAVVATSFRDAALKAWATRRNNPNFDASASAKKAWATRQAKLQTAQPAPAVEVQPAPAVEVQPAKKSKRAKK